MNREQQEMALWLLIFERWYSREGYEPAECGDLADAAVVQFRKRYPVEPAADATGSEASAKAIAALLDDITGDSAFSGFGQSMQSRIYAAVEAMRKGQPAAPPAVWYDEPPRPGEYHVEGLPCVCWVDGDVAWRPDWDHYGERPEEPLNGRRVSPIVKPQEPPQ